MKLKQGLKLRQVGKRYMIVDAGGETMNQACVYSMNAMAARLWQQAAEGDFTEQLLVEWVCQTYEVDAERAEEDVKLLVEQWREYGLIDE